MVEFTKKAQWISGSEVAEFLDDWYAERGWSIEPTTRHEERDLCLGDRHFRRGNKHYLIEYKSGIQTFYTGNLFLETISVDSQGKLGWVYTCRADFIFYAMLLNHKILVFRPVFLRDQITNLKAQFRETKTRNNQNDTYDTHGLIVPAAYAEQHLASQIIHINNQVTQ
jgi:hypothetical protein